jgi:uncharacterized protein (DUF2235 family)
MPKNIVICCDGTSNEFGKVDTNVVRLVQVLDQSPTQLVYYGPGVGTMAAPGAMGRPARMLSKLSGLAFGAGLLRNVAQAYKFLMERWEPGVQVYLFGFSRGAYTVRVLAGMLNQIGLLRPGQEHLVPYAIRYYRARHSDKHTRIRREFRHTFSRPITGLDDRKFPVHFIGAWDTVSSVGWVWNPKTFDSTSAIPNAEHIRHAVSLDERRAFFRQNRFDQGNADLTEYWFSGSHCDVGGGSQTALLWPIAFDWMLQEAKDCGIEVHQPALDDLHSKAPKSVALQTAMPEQSLKGCWWAAETVLKWHYNWALHKKEPRLNLGRARQAGGAVLHPTVVQRIRNVQQYRPPSLPPTFVDQILAGELGNQPVTVQRDEYRPAVPWFAYFVLAVTCTVWFGIIAALAMLVRRWM